MTVVFAAPSLVVLELKKEPGRRGGAVAAGTAPSALPLTSGPGSCRQGQRGMGPSALQGRTILTLLAST